MLDEIIESLPNLTEAIRYCIRISGLKDKQIYMELGIDSGQWSRIFSNQGYFPQDKLSHLMKICRNLVPVMWLANDHECEVKLKKSGFEAKLEEIQKNYEKQLEDIKKEKAELQQQHTWLLEVLKESQVVSNFNARPKAYMHQKLENESEKKSGKKKTKTG